MTNKNNRIASTGIGLRIRQWRKDQLLKGFQLAKIIKISQGSLSDIENSKSDPSAATLVKLYANTDINMHWLFTGEEGKFELGKKTTAGSLVINLKPGSTVTIKCNGK